jgi:hypothetical protein
MKFKALFKKSLHNFVNTAHFYMVCPPQNRIHISTESLWKSGIVNHSFSSAVMLVVLWPKKP